MAEAINRVGSGQSAHFTATSQAWRAQTPPPPSLQKIVVEQQKEKGKTKDRRIRKNGEKRPSRNVLAA